MEVRGRWARWWRKPHAGKPLGWRFGPRARTKNMFFMVVTLDVSKVSGWLNSDASCRVAGEVIYTKRGEVQAEAAGRWARWWS